MNVPRFWARSTADVRNKDGRSLELAAWGWSSYDRSEAEAKARERLARLRSRVEHGLELSHGYAYAERPLREEIVEELRAPRGEVVGVVTRNSYGSRVGAWFGVARHRPEAETLARLKTVLAGVSGSSFRIYRTAAGFRVLATDPVFKPGSAEAEKLMTQLDADPAFVRLCRAQESFRARLTPKPWRCGCERPAGRFPREHAHDEERFSEWLQRYDKACDAKATCRVVEDVGWRRVHPDVAPILSVHDRVSKATSTLPLA
jgi:hypothetical protein